MTTTMARAAIVSSAVLNFVLFGVLVFRNYDAGERRVDSPPQSSAAANPRRLVEPRGYTGYEAYYEALLASGFSDEATKPVLLAQLQTEARQAAASSEPAYWQARDASARTFPLRWSAELDHVRAVLTDVYGADAEHDTVFSEVFRPLGPAFPFLTSEQQVQIERIQLEQQLSAVRAMPRPGQLINQQIGPTGASQPPSMPNMPTAVDITPRLAELLGEDVLAEFQLRESRLADQMRGSGVEFSEAEFRETFGILKRLEDSMGDRTMYSSTRSALRTTLGSRRFAQLWASRDPLFSVIEQACASHSLDEETVMTVYEMFNDSQDRVVQAIESSAGNPQRGGESARAERADLERRLSELLGQKVASDIVGAQTQHMVTMSRSQRLAPR
jgi:hypothetical protein